MTSITQSVLNDICKHIDVNYLYSKEGEEMYEKDKSHPLSAILRILRSQYQLKTRMASSSKPILKHGENDIISQNTINVIKAPPGAHKSRLAGIICSALLSQTDIENILGFTKVKIDPLQVLYVDTRRNLDQFAYSLQQMVDKAGYPKENPPDIFSFISLKEIAREQCVEELGYIIACKEPGYHLFIVLDVSNDCIPDSNNPEHTLKLMDLMTNAVKNSNCTFLCIINENSWNEKPIGHLETELINMASTTMQLRNVSRNNQATDLIEVEFLKPGGTKKAGSIFFKYSDAVNGLVLVENNEEQKSGARDEVEREDDLPF